MPENDLPLVPPARLAVLLTAKRRESGVDLIDLARRSDQRFSPAMLERIEKGLVQLDETDLRHLVRVYGLESAVSLPVRSKLILDLDTHQLGVGDTMIPFESSTTEVVLERYVSLLYLLRNEKPGRILSLRDDDLDVLGSSLDLPVSRLTSDLGAIMGAQSTDQRTSRLSRHLSLGAAGLLVGLTAVGSLIIVGAPEGNDVVTGPVNDADLVATPVSTLSSSGDVSSEIRREDHRIGSAAQPSGATLLGDLAETPRQAIVVADVAVSSPVLEAPNADPLRGEIEETAAEAPSAPAGLKTNVEETTVEETTVEETTVEETTVEAVDTTGVIDLEAIESHLGRDLQSLVPGWSIQVRADLRGYKGQTNRIERTITVFLDQGSTVADTAEILAHEIGHAIDLDHLDTDTRLQWVEMRGMPKVWWAGEGLSDFAVGAGDFAEGVAAYLSGSPSASDYGEFTAEQLAFVGQFVG